MARWKARTIRALTAALTGCDATSLSPRFVGKFAEMPTRELRRRGVNADANGGWRRVVRCVGFALALIAVIVQVAVGFGHHHFDLAGSRPSARANKLSAAWQMAQTRSPDSDRQNRHAPTAPGHAPCFVCAAIHAAAAPAADPPQSLWLRSDNGALMPEPAPAAMSAAMRVAAFDSRGPPLS
jgi:hypothetical protein